MSRRLMSNSMPDGKVYPEQFRGWLLKWTNYLHGYQKRWIVLANGVLSYYRTQEEMAHRCRGTINLAAAFIDTIDSTNFMITNGPSQVYHLRARDEVERQRWVTALELAKAKAIKKLDSDVSDSQSDSEEDTDGGRRSAGASHEKPLAVLQEKLKGLSAAYDLVVKNSHQLLTFASECESGDVGDTAAAKPKEKFALFKITAAAMVKAAEEFIGQARNTERRWSRALQHERSLRLQLEENLETLASQMHGLEDEARLSMLGNSHNIVNASSSTCTPTSEVSSQPPVVLKLMPPRKKVATFDSPEEPPEGVSGDEEKPSDEEERFFDAPEIVGEGGKVDIPSPRSSCEGDIKEILPLISTDRRMTVPDGPPPSFFDSLPRPRQRRTSIPPKPKHKLSLWTVMKNSIGKDLSKIPLPVNFNEPLSMLQRMSEDLLYSKLLSRAVQCPNTMEEAAYVAAFVNSAFGSLDARMAKPFNPMLYETFECDLRSDPEYGWRIIAEQVSHHPPMFAMHVEHKDWTFWQEYTVTSKFRGKYLICYPLGCCHVVMHGSKSHYTWTKVNTTIHNIIVGKLWMDLSGDLKVINHTTKEECHVKYHAYSYFSREKQRKITGTVKDAKGTPHYAISGHWDETFNLARLAPTPDGKKTWQIATPEILWKPDPIPPGREAMYNFSDFTCVLNEPEEGVAPTDCRLRPDMRIMEQQDFDGANAEKVKLEEKQRGRRRKREAMATKAVEAAAAGNVEEAEHLKKASSISPFWFSKEYDLYTNSMMHVYKGSYWETKAKGSWQHLNLPDIF